MLAELSKIPAATLVVVIILAACAHQVIGYYEKPRGPVYLETRVGSHALLNCHVQFPQDIPIPYVLNWKKDDRMVFSWYDGELSASELYIGRITLIDNLSQFGKGSVNLTSIRESDSGWYECKVHFPNRSPRTRNNGTWIHLAVDGGALLKIPPVNQTVMEGELARFECVMKFPDVSFTMWYKDGRPFSELHDLVSRSTMSADGSLLIERTIMTDLGEYECVVQDRQGEKQSARAFLNVQYKAKVIFAPAEVFLPHGQPAILDCHFQSNPALTNLRWEKDGFLFDPYNVQGVFYQRNGSLYFSHVDDTHAGRYSCTPYNELGTAGPSTLTTVIVQRPPEFAVRPKEIYISKLGQTVTLVCEAKQLDAPYRFPQITWIKKDGQPLPIDRHDIEFGNLTIESIVEADRGIYQCSVTNEAATITAETELFIENVPPHPPYNLTANSSDTAITLRWEPGYIRPNLEYLVWFRQPKLRTWRITTSRRNIREMTITGLDPDTEYEFMVESRDAIYHDGMTSDQYRYITKPTGFRPDKELSDTITAFQPIGPPRNLTVEEGPEHYTVSWEPPDFGRDKLRVYILRWWSEPGHVPRGNAETRELYYQIKEHLDEDEMYTFQVFSLSTNDYQAGSNEFEIYVPPYRRMRAIVIGSTAGLFFLLAVAAIILYTKRRWIGKLTSTGSAEKIDS